MSIEAIFANPKIRWHQRFAVDGHVSPGYHDMAELMSAAQMPLDMSGTTVIDIGTTNGATAFEAEKRGAKKVVAVDICPPDVFGFADLHSYLKSDVRFLQASVYELPERLNGETFDYCIFWGVLYHLRHPLLGLDALSQIASRHLTVETVISSASEVSATFFRRDELSNDGSNWWAPSESCLSEMLGSSGFEATLIKRWDAGVSERVIMNCEKVGNAPEYLAQGYDREICRVRFSSRQADRVA